MTTYICVKTTGRFRQGRTYTFNTLTAVAGTAVRGGFLKPLATGGHIKTALPHAFTEPVADLVIPTKKRGRPRKQNSVPTKDIEGLE